MQTKSRPSDLRVAETILGASRSIGSRIETTACDRSTDLARKASVIAVMTGGTAGKMAVIGLMEIEIIAPEDLGLMDLVTVQISDIVVETTSMVLATVPMIDTWVIGVVVPADSSPMNLIAVGSSDTKLHVIGVVRHVIPITEEIRRIEPTVLVEAAGIVVQIFMAAILDIEDRTADRDTIITRIDAASVVIQVVLS